MQILPSPQVSFSCLAVATDAVICVPESLPLDQLIPTGDGLTGAAIAVRWPQLISFLKNAGYIFCGKIGICFQNGNQYNKRSIVILFDHAASLEAICVVKFHALSQVKLELSDEGFRDTDFFFQSVDGFKLRSVLIIHNNPLFLPVPPLGQRSFYSQLRFVHSPMELPP